MVIFLIGIFIFGFLIFLTIKNHKSDSKKTITYNPVIINLNGIQLEFFNFLNNFRSERGLSPLIPEKLCTELSIERIKKLGNDFENHSGFTYYREFLEERGFSDVGEVLSKEHNTVQSVFNNYIKSDKHRPYFEDPNLKYVGAGIIVNENNNFNSCIIFTKKHSYLLRYFLTSMSKMVEATSFGTRNSS